MVAPVFLEDAEFASTLTLVNDAIQGPVLVCLSLTSTGWQRRKRNFSCRATQVCPYASMTF